ncbi:MAG: DUF3459 domain-containing protein [Actinomycetales bacterium]
MGLARGRAATAFALALPGSTYLFQGEELGLPEVDLPDEVRQDPAWHRSGGTDGFRDGCRVPLPWSADGPTYGFSPTDRAWLPQPDDWAGLSVAAQEADPTSTLAIYRELLRQRRAQPALHSEAMTWLPELAAEPAALGMRRFGADGSVVDVVLNLADASLELPPTLGTQVLAASGEQVAIVDESDRCARLVLGPGTCVWLQGPSATG